ncbi:MAG: GGDEF domain-containing protein [Pseudomonadota bacterium]
MNAEALSREENRRIWFRHAMFASAGMLVLTVIAFGYLIGDYFRTSPLEFLLIFTLAWIGQAVLVWLISSARSERFRDPALTAPLMIWSTIFILVAAYYVDVGELAGGTRLSIMMMFFGVLTLGSFRLAKRWFYLISTATNFGYCYVLYLAFTDPEISKGVTESVELVQILMFIFLTTIFARTGAEIAALQTRLHDENAALEANTARIRDLAIRDELTQLFNRRHIMDVLREQKMLADSGGYSFVLGYIDLDHFKRINDTYGHGVGDIVLKRFSDILRHSLREVDYAGRLGGEEFVVVLTRTKLADALVVTERIRRAIESADFSDVQPGLKVTTSLGVTAYASPETLEDVLGRADSYLYQAKQGGRNKVVSGEGGGSRVAGR